MKTKIQLQEAVDEIRGVCNKHGIVIIGTCYSEGIFGEISIGEDSQIKWSNIKNAIDNVVSGDEVSGYSVQGIGN